MRLDRIIKIIFRIFPIFAENDYSVIVEIGNIICCIAIYEHIKSTSDIKIDSIYFCYI